MEGPIQNMSKDNGRAYSKYVLGFERVELGWPGPMWTLVKLQPPEQHHFQRTKSFLLPSIL
jgi:hypothetical protein